MSYVIVTDGCEVIDFGIVDFTAASQSKVLLGFRAIVARFRPHTVCLQDIRAGDCRLGSTARQLVSKLGRECRGQKLPAMRVSKRAILNAMSLPDRTTKDELASKLANLYPPVAHLLPHPRKLWEAEARYMAIFTALSIVHANSYFTKSE